MQFGNYYDYEIPQERNLYKKDIINFDIDCPNETKSLLKKKIRKNFNIGLNI